MFFGHNYQVVASFLNSKLPFFGLGLIGVYIIYLLIKKFYGKDVKALK